MADLKDGSPQIAGPITNLQINDDDDDDDNDPVLADQTSQYNSTGALADLCHICARLTASKIIGRHGNHLGFTFRKDFNQSSRDAAFCKLCRIFVQSLRDANAGIELPLTDRIHLRPQSRNRKQKHMELYALSVHLIRTGFRQSRAGSDQGLQLEAGMISMYTEDGSLASDNAEPPGPIAGREVREASDLETIKHWLDHCLHNHSALCASNTMFHKRSLVFQDDGYDHRLLPTRTVFVDDSQDEDKVYLRENQEGDRAPYVALSYCWGPEAKFLRTTAETIDEHKAGILISGLPETFQHAITITRGLGIKHLWIDALCILQDSKADWDHEAANMGALYAGAHLTIAALSSASASGGLFFDRGLNTEIVELPMDNTTEHQNVRVYLRRCASTSEVPRMIEEEAHSKRAWTLQERYLSPRVLYCAKLQYYWECREMKRVEDGSKFPEGVMQSREQRPQSLVGSLAKARPRAALDLWYEVVQTYSWRSLTYAKDKLTAVEGLVNTFRPYMRSSYVAGVWMADLSQALAWRRSRRCVPGLVRPSRTRAPSWSWASVDGGLNHLNQRVYYRASRPAWISTLENYSTGKLIDVAPNHAASDLGLSDESVCLKLWGPVVSAETTRMKELLKTKATTFLDVGPEDNQDVVCTTGVLSCLILATVPSDSRRAQGLLLREIAPGLHERVGLVDIKELQPLNQRLEKRTLVIA